MVLWIKLKVKISSCPVLISPAVHGLTALVLAVEAQPLVVILEYPRELHAGGRHLAASRCHYIIQISHINMVRPIWRNSTSICSHSYTRLPGTGKLTGFRFGDIHIRSICFHATCFLFSRTFKSLNSDAPQHARRHNIRSLI